MKAFYTNLISSIFDKFFKFKKYEFYFSKDVHSRDGTQYLYPQLLVRFTHRVHSKEADLHCQCSQCTG